MATTGETRECPYCKEEIKAEAIKCKHCKSALAPARPTHGGTCPFCSEEVKPEAIKCKHCGSMIGGGPTKGCCEGCGHGETSFATSAPTEQFQFVGSPGGLSPAPEGSQLVAANCSGCMPGKIGNFRFSYRVCCKRTWIPFLGVVNVCWFEPCNSIPEGPILA